MRTNPAAILVPGVAAVVAVGLIALWIGAVDVQGISARLPGMDRPAGDDSLAPAGPLVGVVAPGPGRPAGLAGSWSRFRGETLDGSAHETVPLKRSWPKAGPPVLWSIELGEGHAGAAVRNGCVYVLDYDRQSSADVLRCLSLADGVEIWRFSYPVVVKRNHGMSRTVPTVTDRFVVGIGPKCHAFCLDAATGKCHWLLDMTREFGATVPQWYAGQCPLIDGDRVILAPGGPALLVALDLLSGEVVWKSPNPHGWTMTHVSITPMDLAGRKTYVYCGSGGVAGVAADDGSLLWDTTDWKIGMATVPSPVVLPERRIFLSGGYGAGAVMLQVRESKGRFAAETLFRLTPRQFSSEQQTPILFDGHLFGVRQQDKQLVCLGLDGKEVWKSGSRHRFGAGRGPYLIADGLIFLLDDDGVLTLAEATSQGYRPLAQAAVFHEGRDAWGPMALVNGRLLARDLTRLMCLDVAESLPREKMSEEVNAEHPKKTVPTDAHPANPVDAHPANPVDAHPANKEE